MTYENFDRVKHMRGAGTFLQGACLLAALDCISDIESIPVAMYQEYDDTTLAFVSAVESGAKVGHDNRQLFRKVMRSLGHGSAKGLIQAAVSTPEVFEDKLQKARQGGRRVVAYVETHHCVGLKPAEDNRWVAHGTYIPQEIADPDGLQPENIFPAIITPIRKGNIKYSNLLMFPPERRRNR